ncbi:membrane integrity-associated transporter subunit PqiC [Pseudomaricurvus hydrocarbonicus]
MLKRGVYAGLTLLTAMTLSACLSSDAPEVHYYLLRSDAQPEAVTQKPLAHVRLAPVKIAPYLDQAGIVLQTANERVSIAQNHLWSEPLSFSLNNFLSREISAAYGRQIIGSSSPSGDSQWVVNVNIDQLHGHQSGDVLLVAHWALSAEPKQAGKLTYYTFSQSQPLTADGYDALVSAEKQLLIKLAGAIANSLPRPTASAL